MKHPYEINPIVPTPWLAAEATRVLQRYINTHPHVRILEFGSGCSTAFFSTFQNVHTTSFEHHPLWYSKVIAYLQEHKVTNVSYHHMKNPYHTACEQFADGTFDIVFVDGLDRVACITQAKRLVKPGGFLFLDDAQHEKYKPAFEIMKGWPVTIITQLKDNPVSGQSDSATTAWWHHPIQELAQTNGDEQK